jgi:hypothetical protein
MDKYFDVLDRIAANSKTPIDGPRVRRRMRNELIRVFDCRPEARYIIRVWRETREKIDDTF